MSRKSTSTRQLSLFDLPNEKTSEERIKEALPKNPTVLDFIKARFEHGPDMTQEEYKRWIRVLVNQSLKKLD
ncbi:MAG: hypothetical protein KGP28_07100 [Bdellovibrionales bacterium]|nr:hypothetical protein [Bdellovibrionales bacterium]